MELTASCLPSLPSVADTRLWVGSSVSCLRPRISSGCYPVHGPRPGTEEGWGDMQGDVPLRSSCPTATFGLGICHSRSIFRVSR